MVAGLALEIKRHMAKAREDKRSRIYILNNICPTDYADVVMQDEDAFDSLGGTRTEQFWRCLHSARYNATDSDWLFRNTKEEAIRAQFRQEPCILQMLQDETELLGYTVSGHPLDCHPNIRWDTYCPISELPRYHHQRVTVCGLIIVSRSHLQQDGEPMKFISICDRSGIVECEIFADAYRAYGLATVRYPIVQVTAEVTPFDNQAGFTLSVQRIEKARHIQTTKASS